MDIVTSPDPEQSYPWQQSSHPACTAHMSRWGRDHVCPGCGEQCDHDTAPLSHWTCWGWRWGEQSRDLTLTQGSCKIPLVSNIWNTTKLFSFTHYRQVPCFPTCGPAQAIFCLNIFLMLGNWDIYSVVDALLDSNTAAVFDIFFSSSMSSDITLIRVFIPTLQVC